MSLSPASVFGQVWSGAHIVTTVMFWFLLERNVWEPVVAQGHTQGGGGLIAGWLSRADGERTSDIALLHFAWHPAASAAPWRERRALPGSREVGPIQMLPATSRHAVLTRDYRVTWNAMTRRAISARPSAEAAKAAGPQSDCLHIGT